MSVWEQIQNALDPHAQRLNQTIAAGAVLIHNRLERIESAVSDLGRPDVGDKWVRLIVSKKKLASEEKFELAEVPPNEVWLFQAITVDGVFNKSPAFIVCGDVEDKLYFSVIKEGVGTETVGGDMVAMPGETLFLIPRAEGVFAANIHIVRRKIPNIVNQRQATSAQPLLQGRNTHEVQRDLIASANGQWEESPRETQLPPHERVTT